MISGGTGAEAGAGEERRRDGVLVLSVWQEAAPPDRQGVIRYRVLCDPTLTGLAQAHWLATSDDALEVVRRWLRMIG